MNPRSPISSSDNEQMTERTNPPTDYLSKILSQAREARQKIDAILDAARCNLKQRCSCARKFWEREINFNEARLLVVEDYDCNDFCNKINIQKTFDALRNRASGGKYDGILLPLTHNYNRKTTIIEMDVQTIYESLGRLDLYLNQYNADQIIVSGDDDVSTSIPADMNDTERGKRRYYQLLERMHWVIARDDPLLSDQEVVEYSKRAMHWFVSYVAYAQDLFCDDRNRDKMTLKALCSIHSPYDRSYEQFGEWHGHGCWGITVEVFGSMDAGDETSFFRYKLVQYIMLYPDAVNHEDGFYECSSSFEISCSDLTNNRILLDPSLCYFMLYNGQNSNHSNSINKGVPICTAIASLQDYDYNRKETTTMRRCLYTQGGNLFNCLGMTSLTNSPNDSLTPVIFHPLSSMERIISIATSPSHTLILTSFGLVYSIGNGADGALGLGDLKSSFVFRHVEWFIDEAKDPIIIKEIATGGDANGCHSAAIDYEGKLYTWGKRTACGHDSDIKSSYVAMPAVVSYFHANQLRVQKVSCGGGFTLILATRSMNAKDYDDDCVPITSNVYSFGAYEGGKLGLGPAPIVQGASKRRRRLRYQMRPKCISLHNIRDVCAGTSHSLAVGIGGEVYAWGCNDAGQCGTSSFSHIMAMKDFDSYRKLHNSVYDDVYSPRAILPFGYDHHNGYLVHGSTVAAGMKHSAVIDVRGQVWTWGRGTFDVPKTADAADGGDFVGIEMSPDWMKPCVVEAFQDLTITHVDLGNNGQCSAVTDDGILYSWNHRPTGVECLTCYNYKYASVLHGQRCIDVRSSGNHTFIVTDHGLPCPIFERVTLSSPVVVNPREYPYFDCIIVAGGGEAPGHKAVLARRSPVFERMIRDELLPGQTGVIELLLPDVSYQILIKLMEYLYTDNVKLPVHGDVSVIAQELLRCAEMYDLPMLAALLDDFINGNDDAIRVQQQEGNWKNHSFSSLLEDDYWHDAIITLRSTRQQIRVHKFVLAMRCKFFKSLFQDSFGKHDNVDDLSSYRNNRSIPIFELPYDCEITFESLQCVIRFIYLGIVEYNSDGDADQEMLKDSLRIAHYFGLDQLKTLCQSYLIVSMENSEELHCLATSTNSFMLCEKVKRYLLQLLFDGETTKIKKSPLELKCEVFPKLLKFQQRQYYSFIGCSYGQLNECILKGDNGLMAQLNKQRHSVEKRMRQRDQKKQDAISAMLGANTLKFPKVELSLLFFLTICYKLFERVSLSEYVVAAINACFLAGAFVVYHKNAFSF